MIARLTIAGRRWLSDATDSAAALASTMFALGERWLSDAYAPDGEPEFGVAVAQALIIGVPCILIGIALMAALP